MKLDKKTLTEASGHVGQAISQITSARDDADSEWQEKSEKWQESDAGQEAQTKIEELGEMLDNLDTIQSVLDELTK